MALEARRRSVRAATAGAVQACACSDCWLLRAARRRRKDTGEGGKGGRRLNLDTLILWQGVFPVRLGQHRDEAMTKGFALGRAPPGGNSKSLPQIRVLGGISNIGPANGRGNLP